MLQHKFFIIVKYGLNITPVTSADINEFGSCTLEEWQELTNLAIKQGIAGVFFDGIQEIYKTDSDILPKCEWAREIKARLLGITLQLEQYNKKQIVVMNKVAAFLKKYNCRMMVMKGQACATMYPNPLHRSIGDIDCYLYNDYTRGNELIAQTGIHVDDSCYKHSEFCIEGETFENHQYFVATRGGERYKRLDRKLKELAREKSTNKNQKTRDDDLQLTNDRQNYLNAQHSSINVQYPPVMFNALFLTYHAYIHFMIEGLRLKQVLDWVMFVRSHQDDVDWKELHKICEEFKLDRFLRVMNAIVVKVFGVEKKASEMICDSPYIQKVLDSILYDDDYIFNTGKGNFRKRLHIISNMFKHRWKYRDISEENVIKLISIKMIGLLFKTET